VVYNIDGWAQVYDNCRHDRAEVSVPSSEIWVSTHEYLRVLYNIQWLKKLSACSDVFHYL
jgi:hypothetical protein